MKPAKEVGALEYEIKRSLGQSDGHVLMATDEWFKNSFNKVVCKVSDEEFAQAKVQADKHSLAYRNITESALDNEEIGLVFAPAIEFTKFFKFLRLYK